MSPSRSRSPLALLSNNENRPALDASASPAELLKIARRYELEKNNAQVELKTLHRKLSDVTNGDQNTPLKLKRRRIRARSASSDPEDEDAVHSRADDSFVYQSGHKFFLVYGPWIHLSEYMLETNFDEAYNVTERFENNESRAQGQLQEIWSLLQGKFERDVLQQKWVHRAFLKGLKTERYNTASRIQNHCGAILQVSEVDLMNAEVRKTKFCDQIGWVDNDTGGGSYSTVNFEILHKDYSGEYTLGSIFLNPILMGLYIALIRGPKVRKSFVAGASYHPQTETMAQIHRICNTTLGAIATASILARWALSSDKTLQPVGTSSGIHYFEDYEEYVKLLAVGLRRKKKSVVNIIKEWDSRIFPNTDSSLVIAKAKPGADNGVKRALDSLDANSEAENENRDGG